QRAKSWHALLDVGVPPSSDGGAAALLVTSACVGLEGGGCALLATTTRFSRALIGAASAPLHAISGALLPKRVRTTPRRSFMTALFGSSPRTKPGVQSNPADLGALRHLFADASVAGCLGEAPRIMSLVRLGDGP